MSDWIDLTRPMNSALPIYSEGPYADPPFATARWSEVAREGFEVWQLSLGTQTGTHIDAPSHFVSGGACLESLSPADCIGQYFHLSAAALARGHPPDRYQGERLLFLDAHPEVVASEVTLQSLLALPARVWIMAGALRIHSSDPFRLNRALAQAGRFLIEDLNPSELARVPPRGEAVALPLRLTGVSGSPVRLLVRGLDA
ncbi:cyclase family protein [Rhodobacteraceae bacterium DSL-40]|uniref:cyclase family protein n=1 Tax=Amaricoccus sp. B4 TaxID=3368557 RepID=UPI000DACC682